MADLEQQAREMIRQLATKEPGYGMSYHSRGICGTGTAELRLYGKRAEAARWLMEHGPAALAFRAAQPGEGEVDMLRHKLLMIVSHATGGHSQDIDASVNDICVRISQHRNAIYQAGKDAALTTPPAGRPEKEARPTPEMLADIIDDNIAGPGIGDPEIAALHREDQLRAARAILALFPTDDGSRKERMREALGRIDKFVADFLAPWGSWKTAWWEGEVSDDVPFRDEHALRHVAKIARAALSDPQEQERGR